MIDQIVNGMTLGVGFAFGSALAGLVSAAFRWAWKNPAQ